MLYFPPVLCCRNQHLVYLARHNKAQTHIKCILLFHLDLCLDNKRHQNTAVIFDPTHDVIGCDHIGLLLTCKPVKLDTLPVADSSSCNFSQA